MKSLEINSNLAAKSDYAGILNLDDIEKSARSFTRYVKKMMEELSVPAEVMEGVKYYREQLQSILDRMDDRLIVICGPCSIHDEVSAIDYAQRLLKLAPKVEKKIMLVMRTYFEKPRTTVGWKGFVADPDLDGSGNIGSGIYNARKLLLQVAKLGVPTATEMLDPVFFPFMEDLISYVAIGARTVESQIHRQVASGLPCPVGLKNSTDGRVESSVEALEAVSCSHSFIEPSLHYGFHVKTTAGNNYAHVILRGGKAPNYDSESIMTCEKALMKANLKPSIIVDCSHGNSGKKAANQSKVLRDCVRQIKEGNQSIIGFMLESNIHHGKQDVRKGTPLLYGVSITDECIGWEETEELILELAE